ncbi:hypothetical protein TWF730_005441 [Orbilia blumenaviensis]|uniref:Alpha-type protein kinase domain-containing protein n=1 Tax=Orbilia blumenaviensis TaxID=1796055 RepID=A0AAV9VLN9_9PEZI
MASNQTSRSSATVHRSRRSASQDVRSLADDLLRASLTRGPASVSTSSSTASTVVQSPARAGSSSSSSSVPKPGTASSKAGSGISSSTKGSSIASTKTRERLQGEIEKLRRELDSAKEKEQKMRNIADKERGIADRLKREGDLPVLTATEIDSRIRSLKREERKATSQVSQRSNKGLFKSICATDLLFLIDTTGSMASYIEAAKNQIKSIVKDIKAAFLNEAEVRIAVVGYKDHSDSPNIQFLDFTSTVDQVYTFLTTLNASGGADTPEDVLGGIQQALSASWAYQTRCIIHIADAPPHGRTLHDLGDYSDSYPDPGSEPHGLTHLPLLSKMVERRINYVLLRIHDNTDRMAFEFLQMYSKAMADCSLLRTNRYYNSVSSSNNKSGVGGLLMREAELGITFSALRQLVVKAVTASATRTAARYVSRVGKTGFSKRPGPKLTAIGEDDAPEPVVLENTPPRWGKTGWLNETLTVEGFTAEVTAHSSNTLDDMMKSDGKIKMNVLELTLHKRQMPFAQGALRVAFYARTAASNNRYVVKSSKQENAKLPEMAEDMRCQALCKSFAHEFNELVGVNHSIDFIVTACFKGKSKKTSDDTFISLEPFIEGSYVKYNNNAGYVNEDNPNDAANRSAQAFSHFTFERSQGRFLVCDLQGVGNLLTDPAIHTKDPDRFVLTPTNFGEDGFKLFFSSHECNDICRKLELKSNGKMFIMGKFDFRKNWPKTADTVCCSNKLCGKILLRANAKESRDYPGFQWCNACWPQLELFTVQWICVAPAPYHEFRVSRFFYESQGRGTPRKCPEHRARGEETTALKTTAKDGTKGSTMVKSNSGVLKKKINGAIPSTAVADGKFWTTLKPATVRLEDG